MPVLLVAVRPWVAVDDDTVVDVADTDVDIDVVDVVDTVDVAGADADAAEVEQDEDIVNVGWPASVWNVRPSPDAAAFRDVIEGVLVVV
jgi:hypothetical protein